MHQLYNVKTILGALQRLFKYHNINNVYGNFVPDLTKISPDGITREPSSLKSNNSKSASEQRPNQPSPTATSHESNNLVVVNT